MVLHGYEETIKHRKLMVALLNRILLALAVGFVLLAIVAGLAWWDLRKTRVVPLVLDPPDRRVGWKADTFCLKSKMTFAQGSYDLCHTMGKPGGKGSCEASFSDGKNTLASILGEQRSDPTAYIVTIHGGHDPKPLRPNGDLDSNLDLAYRRAVTVANSIAWPEKGQGIVIRFALGSSRVTSACGQFGDASEKNRAPDFDALRSPIIEITRWTLSP